MKGDGDRLARDRLARDRLARDRLARDRQSLRKAAFSIDESGGIGVGAE